MKKFRFKFEAVLKVRKIREEESLRVLAGAQKIFQERLREKESLLAQLEKALKTRENLANDFTFVGSYQTLQSFIIGTKQRIIHTDQGIVRASRGVEKTLRVYLQAKRQTRAMEILYDKSYSEFWKQAEKRETREFDDLIIMRNRMSGQEGEE